MHTEQPLIFGLIGAGRIGRIHAENLVTRIPGVELVAVSDPHRPAAEEIAAQWKMPKVHSDHHAILDNPAIDAVAICSSTDTHAQFIQDAAQAGKHIFCEKPIDFNLNKIDQALNAVERAGVKFQVGFNRRFDANFQKVRQMVADGKIGHPHVLRITSRDPAPPSLDYIKVSGGLFLDMTIHDFDMARYLMGDEVIEVYAAGGVLVDAEIGKAGDLDTAVITLRFENGGLGTIDNSRQAVYGYDQRVEVFGSQGMVTVSNKVPDTHVYWDKNGLHSTKPLYFFLERYLDSFVVEMQAFVESIQRDSIPPVTGLDGRIPVVMGLAALKSFKENRPVKLSEIK